MSEFLSDVSMPPEIDGWQVRLSFGEDHHAVLFNPQDTCREVVKKLYGLAERVHLWSLKGE